MEQLKQLVLTAVTKGEPIFNHFQELLENGTSQLENNGSCHTVGELKYLTTKQRGDLFELFCQQYLLYIYNCDIVYNPRNLPKKYRELFGLGKQDMGIDLIAFKDEEPIFVQVKYRKFQSPGKVPGRNIWTNSVNWKELSTFNALCEKAEPDALRLVMTSGVSVRRIGGKASNEKSICRGSFQKLKASDYYSMLEIEGQVLGTDNNQREAKRVSSPSIEELRNLRLEKFKSNGSEAK